MYEWQVIFYAKYVSGFDIKIFTAKDVRTVIEENFPHDADRIISITKLMNYD